MKVRIGRYPKWISSTKINQYIGLSEKWEDRLQVVLNACWNERFWNSRKVWVQIDYFDVWDGDHTLALIILPFMKKLKEEKDCGFSHVDTRDAPAHLKKYNKHDEQDKERVLQARYEWVIDEIIWAFEQINNNYAQDHFFQVIKESDNPLEVEYKVDKEGYRQHLARIDNGTRLFGKYYQTFWT